MKIGLQAQATASVLRAEIEAWRKPLDLSREAVAVMVMEKHAELGADQSSGITFDSSSKDIYTRAKTAAQKIYRWLDDGALPADMLPSLLAVLPMDRRLNVLNEMLRPLGVSARNAEDVAGVSFNAAQHATALVQENSEGVVALLAAGANPTRDQLKTALKEIRDVRETASTTERALEAMLDGAPQLRQVG